MDSVTKERLIAAGREDLVIIHEINQSGYAGINRQGQIVDRREFPNATPVPANRLLNMPTSKPWPHSAITAVEIRSQKWVATCTLKDDGNTKFTSISSSERKAIQNLKGFIEDVLSQRTK